MTPDNIDSPAADDTSSVRSVGGNGGLKKGPWTSAEDVILFDYVTEHGEGNWNAVQKHTGLARCGKSCRLRWTNHLRPDLKKGAFTPEEEHLIIELHAKMGNKWARMASELPGRTDNEIKNYWNTRIKKLQRLGLPIYPPEIFSQALDENQQKDNMNSFSSGDGHCRDVMPAHNFEIPPIRFKTLDLNQHTFPLAFAGGGFLDISTSDLLGHGLHSSYRNNSLLSTMHPSKCLQQSESISSATTSNIIPSGSQHQSGSYVQNAQAFIYSSPYDHPIHAGSHAVLIVNPSSSEPTWAMKQELPSLQTQADNWGSPSSSIPSLESADTLIQTPPTESCPLSSQNSGLLDAVLHESQTRKNPRNSSDLLLSSQASDMVTNLTGGSSQLVHETGFEPYGELISPLGHSSSSMLSEPEAGTGLNVKEGEAILDPTQYNKTTNQMFSRPDLLLDSGSFWSSEEVLMI